MKLKSILENLLTEIGDNVVVPPGAKYSVSMTKGAFTFDFHQLKYVVTVTLPIHQFKSDQEEYTKITMMVDFTTTSTAFGLTLQNKALLLMSNVVGGLTEWLNRWKEKFNSNELIEIVYIKFNAQKEEDEEGNRRSKMYKLFLQKFAQKHGTSVSFSGGTNEVIAKFDKLIY